MKIRIFIRLVLAFAIGYLSSFIARSDIPPNVPFALPDFFRIIFAFIGVVVGFFLPDLLSVIAKLGITRLAEDITERVIDRLPMPSLPSAPSMSLPFRDSRKPKKPKYINPLILDTSAIIDGRFADICETGFIFGDLLVIPSVLLELQHIADSSDDLKRSRGRMGLAILDRLKKNKKINLEILKSDPVSGWQHGSGPHGTEVDQKLLALAKKVKGKIVTVDFNLNQVARLSNVEILNVNELANKVKIATLPGEEIKIKVVQIGKEATQGVGYLSDGTMIVVEDGSGFVGKTIPVVVTRVLQTVAGKMVFTRLKNGD
ncbi:MAG TPA: hypothetical protein VIK81_04615 [Patescibacteria group bacterium]